MTRLVIGIFFEGEGFSKAIDKQRVTSQKNFERKSILKIISKRSKFLSKTNAAICRSFEAIETAVSLIHWLTVSPT